MSITNIRQSLQSALQEAAEAVKTDFETALKEGVCIEEKISETGLPDFVSATDKRSERIIRKSLLASHPTIAFVGEESGGTPEDSGYFLVDPLDGTSNFMSLRSYFGICAAYIEGGEVLTSAVAEPMTGNIVSAERGNGVYVNGVKRLHDTSAEAPLSKIQLECELALSSANDFALAQKIVPHTSGLRKSGSTALDLAHLAQGRQIVCVANHLQPYDIAAPLLIAREAGCIVSDFQGNPATVNSKEIIAARPERYREVLNLMLS